MTDSHYPPLAELSFHLFCIGTRPLSPCSRNGLRRLGLTADEIVLLKRLTLDDLKQVCQCSHDFLTLRFDHPRLLAILHQAAQAAPQRQVHDKLLRQQASGPMMKALCGMNSVQYAQRRRALGLAGAGVGRPTVATDADQMVIWQAWHRHRNLDPIPRYLATAQDSGQPLNVIWALVQAWQQEASPSGSAGDKPVPNATENPNHEA